MWKDYFDDRLIKEHEDGFYIIKPKEYEPSIPFLCPKCNKKMNKINDSISFRHYFCCSECEGCLGKSSLEEWASNYINKKDS